MKNKKRILAAIAAAALTISSVSVINADAIAWQIDDISYFYNAEDIEEFNDYYQLNDCFACQYDWSADENGIVAYKVFRVKDRNIIYGIACPQQNYLQIQFNDTESKEIWQSIFEKYSDKLDFDYIYSSDLYLKAFDYRDKNGEYTYFADDVESKYAIIKKMCRELYNAGVVADALYMRYNAFPHDLSVGSGEKLYISNFTGEFSELQSFFSGYDESFVVEEAEGTLYDYCVDIGVTTEDLRWEISNALEAKFAGADAQTIIHEDYSGTSTIGTGSLNVLASVKDDIICDVNGDGNADIADATTILSSYAESAAGIQKLSDDNSMDVNGDGEVSIDDATYILTYYAESAAGLR